MSRVDKVLYYTYLAIMTLFFFPTSALGQGKYLDYEQPAEVNSPNLFWELTKIILALAFVIGVAYFLLNLLGKKSLLPSNSNIIKVIETVYLAQNRMISLVEIGDKVLVLGITDSNISLLQEITDKELIELFNSKKMLDVNKANAFSNQLDGFMKKISIPNGKAEKKTETEILTGKRNMTDEYESLQNYFQRQKQMMNSRETKNESREESK